MSDLSEIEELLLVAVRALGGIPPIMKDLHDLNTPENRKVIGSAIYELMELRERVYVLDPRLKPAHMGLYERDASTYQELVDLVSKSFQYEESGDFLSAEACFGELLGKSELQHFQHIAQAGLYRTQQARERENT